MFIHLTLIPYMATSGELKTKPTQHSVQKFREYGIQPEIIVCRTEQRLNSDIKEKIASFCNVRKDAVIESIDAETIYDVPLLMEAEKLDEVVLDILGLPRNGKADLVMWKDFLQKLKNPKKKVKIGLVGKYVELKDAYKSIVEGFVHAGASIQCDVDLKWIHSESLTNENVSQRLTDLSGIIVAPGFGTRGIEGKIAAVNFARINNIPFFGICLGMQCAVIEFARNVLNLKDAHTTEIDAHTSNPVIDMMQAQKDIVNMGGTMRLGAYPCILKPDSHSSKAYGKLSISERHRHRYEFNDKYKELFELNGMIMTGVNPDSKLVEIVEIPNHNYFVGVQFHPEYKSTVENPHPLFVSFIKASIDFKEKI